MAKLSKAQISALDFMAKTNRPKSLLNTNIRRDTVSVLVRKGLMRWLEPSTFEITDAGRKALQDKE